MARCCGKKVEDHSIGTWKLNVDKCKTTPPSPNPIANLTAVFEVADRGVKLTIDGARQDGTAIHFDSVAKYDGKEYPVTGNAPYDIASVKRVNADTFTFEDKKAGGKYHTKGREVISKDGKHMTVTIKGVDNEGHPISQRAVYDRQ